MTESRCSFSFALLVCLLALLSGCESVQETAPVHPLALGIHVNCPYGLPG